MVIYEAQCEHNGFSNAAKTRTKCEHLCVHILHITPGCCRSGVCDSVLTLCSLRAGTPFADAREALRVSQEQATAADSQRSC